MFCHHAADLRVLRLAAVLAWLFHGLTPFESAAAETPVAPQRRALLIGVNNYAHINRLFYCGSDMLDLQKRLVEAGFPASQVTLLCDLARDPKDRPLRANIEHELDALLRNAAKGDLVLVAFSGHGVHLGGTSYLCPLEAQLEQPRQTMISLEDVYTRLHKCQAAQKLLLVDACRNDPHPGGEKRPDKPTDSQTGFSRTLEKPPEGILLLTSCMPGQVSVEDEDVRHGVFMNYLLRGLDGDADRDGGNSNGKISLLELFQYANVKTRAHVAATRNLVQTPMLRGEMEGDFELALTPARRPKAEMIPSMFRDARRYLPARMAERSLRAADAQSLRALQTACNLLLPGSGYHRGIGRMDCQLAIAACNEVIRREPENAFAYYFRGLAYQTQGDFRAALADFQRIDLPMVVEIKDGDSSVSLETDGRMTGKAYQNDQLNVTRVTDRRLWVDSVRGSDGIQGWIDQDRIKIGLLYCKENVRSTIRSLFYEDAQELLTAEKPETREKLFQAQKALLPLRSRSNQAESTEPLDRAILACEEVLRLEPKNESAHMLRGVAYCWKRDYARALADFKKLDLPLPLQVRYVSGDEGVALRVEDREAGRVKSYADLNITAVEGPWLWVDSVEHDRRHDDPAREARGWIHQDQVAPE